MKTRTNYYANTDGLAGLRNRLGFSQQELAIHLQVSRSLVSMVEKKQRSIPAAMLIKMASLEINLAGNQMQAQKIQPHPAEKEFSVADLRSPSLFERELKCKLESRKFSEKLEQMEQQYQETRMHLELLSTLLSTGTTDTDQISWWKAAERSCLKKLEKCSLQQQAILRNRVALLNAERQLLQNTQQHFGNNT